MAYIDVTAKTEVEAIAKALAQLNRDRDDVSVEILERAKSGFLGIGASPAKIRVTYDDIVETAAVVSEPAPQEEKPAEEPKVEAEPVREEPAEKPEKVEKPERPERPVRAERPAKPNRGGRSGQPQRPPRPQMQSQPQEIPQPVDLGEEVDDERAQRIRTFLSGLLEHLDSEAQIKIYQPEKDRYKVFLEGEKLGQLIGRRGETLDAIQQLTNYAVNRGSERRIRIHVDAENYREKREQSLRSLALKVAGKVVRYRKNVTLEPMNAYERHVIHTALQDYEHVTTYSMGTDPNRRVVVAYEK